MCDSERDGDSGGDGDAGSRGRGRGGGGVSSHRLAGEAVGQRAAVGRGADQDAVAVVAGVARAVVAAGRGSAVVRRVGAVVYVVARGAWRV